MDELWRGLRAYLRQQAESDMPDLVLSPELVSALLRHAKEPRWENRGVSTGRAHSTATAAVTRRTSASLSASSGHYTVGPRTPIAGLGRTAAGVTAGEGVSGRKIREELKALYYRVRQCKECPLSARRKNFVFGAGNAEAQIMVIGEAPGAEEDEQGRPFVGPAGQLLTDMLAAIGLDRTRDVFITNVLKCRPPDNRDPEATEEIKCMPILRRQMEIIRPKVLLLLGRVAAGAVLGKSGSIASLRGQIHYCGETPAFVTYHPAALLRTPSYKRPAWEDLQRFAAFLDQQGITHGSRA